MAIRRNEMLVDVAAQVAQLALEYGVSHDMADSMGNAVADHLAGHWGG